MPNWIVQLLSDVKSDGLMFISQTPPPPPHVFDVVEALDK